MKKIDVNKMDILKIGVEMLTSGNAKNLNLRELSKQAGVSVGTLYNFFGDKEQLQREVLGHFWKRIMLQEELLHGEEIDLVEHVEQAYSLFFNNFQNMNGVMRTNTSMESGHCEILSAFPMTHISEKLKSWVEKLMDFHKDELKEVELKCTRTELVDHIVAIYIGNFIQGVESLGISTNMLSVYLSK